MKIPHLLIACLMLFSGCHFNRGDQEEELASTPDLKNNQGMGDSLKAGKVESHQPIEKEGLWWEHPDMSELKGEPYRGDVPDAALFENFISRGGASVCESQGKRYSVSKFRNGSTWRMAFERITFDEDEKRWATIVDMIDIHNVQENQDVAIQSFELNGRYAPQLIAVYNYPQDKDIHDMPFFKDVLKAWKMDPKTETIEEIDTAGVAVINEGY